jgi:FkbM family methyltransferase
MNYPIHNFTVLESIHGRIIVNRHCAFQAEALAKTGSTHIEGELNNLLVIANTLPQDAVIVDGGANIGLVAVPLAQMGRTRSWTIHAFEPQRMIYNALCGTIALNDLAHVHAHQMGLSDQAGTMTVPAVDYGVPQDYGTVELAQVQSQTKGESVSVIALDDLGLTRLDLLKLDIEGMEIPALRGAKKLIAAHQPWCWIEYWKVGIDAIKAEFAGLDYEFFQVDSLNLICAPLTRWDKQQLNIQT